MHYIPRFVSSRAGVCGTFFVEVEKYLWRTTIRSRSISLPLKIVGEGGASSESLVTPEIEAKFAEVFGNGDSRPGEASATARQHQADVEQEELDEAAQVADAGSAPPVSIRNAQTLT